MPKVCLAHRHVGALVPDRSQHGIGVHVAPGFVVRGVVHRGMEALVVRLDLFDVPYRRERQIVMTHEARR